MRKEGGIRSWLFVASCARSGYKSQSVNFHHGLDAFDVEFGTKPTTTFDYVIEVDGIRRDDLGKFAEPFFKSGGGEDLQDFGSRVSFVPKSMACVPLVRTPCLLCRLG